MLFMLHTSYVIGKHGINLKLEISVQKFRKVIKCSQHLKQDLSNTIKKVSIKIVRKFPFILLCKNNTCNESLIILTNANWIR